MKSSKLHLEDLRIDSFRTTTVQRSKGTVFGEQCTCATCTPSCGGTCDEQCGTWGATCDDATCDIYTGLVHGGQCHLC